MTNLLKITSEIKTKKIEPKIYCVRLVSTFSDVFMHLTIAYSLEEAVRNAKKRWVLVSSRDKIIECTLANSIADAKLESFVFDSISNVINEVSENKIEEVKTSKKSSKNDLMKEIIQNKNKSLFLENIEIFTENEQKLIKDKIENNKNV